MQITRFEVEFVIRTQRLISEYQGEYKLTNLLNCLVGLVVLPSERAQRDALDIWDTKIEDIPLFSELDIKCFEPVRWDNRTRKIVPEPKTLKVFVKRLRHGIAHQNIEHVNNNGYFVGVIIRNKARNNIVDFEVEFRRPTLERFANYIADQYLHHIDPPVRNEILREIDDA